MNAGEQTSERNRTGSAYYDDEISLVDLVMVLWRNRLTVVIVGVLVVAGAFAYALTATPVYKATAYFLPPLAQDVEELNKAKRFGLSGYSGEQVFEDFLANIGSLEVRREFFFDNDLAGYFVDDPQAIQPVRVFDNAFNNNLAIKRPSKGEDGPVVVTFTMRDAEQSADLLNRFTSMAERRTVTQLIANITADIQAKADELETKIASRRALAQKRREDQIVELQEALQVARKLGIERPSDYNFDIVREQLDAVSVNTADLPLYARGTTALEAEIDTLQSRKDDAPFIHGLRDLQEQLAALQAIKVDPAKIKATRVDRPAIVPYQREKPNRKLIVVLGVLAGGFLGILAAFMVEFIKNFRRQLEND